MSVFILEGNTLWKVEGGDRQFIGEITNCNLDAIGELLEIANSVVSKKRHWLIASHAVGRAGVTAAGYVRVGFVRATRELAEYSNAGTELFLESSRARNEENSKDIDELLRRCFDIENQLRGGEDE